MGWDALHPSWLNRGSDVVINRKETWLCCNSPVFALQFCVSEMTVVATFILGCVEYSWTKMDQKHLSRPEQRLVYRNPIY